jgi:Flp pilus assembly protein TadD
LLKLDPAEVVGSFSREPELRGLTTVLIELGLADLPDVVPLVTGAPISPGFKYDLAEGRQTWTGALRLEGHDADLRLVLTVCTPEGPCHPSEASASRDRLEVAVAEVLGETATHLGRTPAAAMQADWASPVSTDPYATLLTGRSAAVWYGLLPAAPLEQEGDVGRDPMDRAAHVDPEMEAAWWLLGRRAMSRGDASGARQYAALGLDANPRRVALLADQAASVSGSGRPIEAAAAWELAAKASPRDPRFLIPLARARLRAGRPAEAGAALDALAAVADQEPAVAELRVAIADQLSAEGASDTLLTRWQEVAADDPEPVRRRIEDRVTTQRYEEALLLVPLLVARGELQAGREIELALAVAVADWGRAAATAEALDDPRTADRVRARAALESGAATPPAELDHVEDPVALVVRGRAWLNDGHPGPALSDARAALALDPWMPEALALEADGLEERGDAAGAEASRARLRRVDPDWLSAQP